MLQHIIENNVRLEKRVRKKIAVGQKANILIIKSSSNTSKVSLISEIQKRSEIFNVFVLSHDQSEVSKRLYSSLRANLIIGGNLEDVLLKNDIDILFIDNPHYYFEFSSPAHDFYNKLSNGIFENILICYVPYAYICISNPEVYTDFFHSFSWRFYLESYFHLLEVGKYAKTLPRLPNQVVTGHPYIDPYCTDEFDFNFAEISEHRASKKLVWCPHHNPVFYGGVSISEQEKILRKCLEKNSDLIIFFRPHPNLFGALKSKKHLDSSDYKILLDDELHDTLHEFWLNNPRVVFVEKGPIYEYFKAADVIVHNCGGYQMEALVSGAKVINLVNPAILNKHILQYEDFQEFAQNPVDFAGKLELAIGEIQGPRRRITGFEDQVSAGALIASNLERSLT